MNIRAPNVNAAVRAPLSADQLRAMSGDMFGAKPSVEIPGAEAVEQGIKQYNPYAVEVPRMPDTGLRGVMETPPLTETSSTEDLAQATQSPYAARTRYEPVLDEMGQPQVDESGQYLTQPISMERFGQQQEEELSTVPDFSSAIGDGTDTVGIAQSILGIKTEASKGAPAAPATARSLMESGRATPETVRKWADTSAPTLSLVTEDTVSDLFSPEAIVGSTDEGYEGVPIGMKTLHDHNIPFELARPLSTVFGIAHALANTQTATMRDSDKPTLVVDKNGKRLEDALPEKDIVNSLIHGATNALDRLGYNLPPEAVRRIAEAKVKAEIYKGNYRPVLTKDNHWVLATSPDMKKQARDLAYLTAAMSGDERRRFPSKVPQISGSSFLKPGSQTTRNSLKFPGAKSGGAEVAKDILGSIAEMFDPIAVLSTTKQLADIEANLDDANAPRYSTSIFAKRHKMSEQHYKELKDSVSPDPGMDPKSPEFLAKQEDHAVQEMQARLAKLKYDIQNANDIKGMVYTGYMHSTANQRFFRTNAGTDILASKNGTREMLNFGLKSLVKPSNIFDVKELDAIKEKALSVLSKTGRARQDALMKMSPNERAMLGLMESAVVNFYTFSGDPSVQNKKVAKYAETDLIKMFTPDIALHLANLGREYIDWLSDKPEANHDNILQLLAGMPRGEAQANQNLWYDMAQAHAAFKDPARKNSLMKLSAMNYDDGNQNGVFLQALYAGKPEVAVRLGSYNPSLADMRGFALNKIGDKLDEFLKSKEEKLEGWKNFLTKASLNDGLASDLFKVPLMQYAYGKDGSMFTEHIYEFIKDSDTYAPIAYQTLIESGAYANLEDAAADMSNAMEATLNEVIDPQFTSMLKRIGRMFAIMSTVPTVKGVASDDWVFSPVDVGFIPDASRDEVTQERDEQGNVYAIKKRGIQTTSYMTPDGVVESPTAIRQNNPNATKGTQSFYNKNSNTHDTFENPLGSALSRLLGVMPIQSTDGDLLKLMLIAVNADQKIPLPVATVHDSLITSMDTMHLYRNAYNNIAIPQAVPEIKKFASRLKDAYDNARAELFNKIEDMEYIGIGANGDFPSLGSLFDELNKKIYSEQYKQVFMRRSHNSEQAWNNFVAKSEETLAEARKRGWRYDQPNLAVNASQFKELFGLSESLMKVGGAENRFKQWVNNFANNVEQGFKKLNLNPDVRKHGIGQMTQAGGSGKRMAIPNNPAKAPPVPKPKANLSESIFGEEKNKEALKDFGWESNYIDQFKDKPETLQKIINDEFKQKFSDRAKQYAKTYLE